MRLPLNFVRESIQYGRFSIQHDGYFMFEGFTAPPGALVSQSLPCAQVSRLPTRPGKGGSEGQGSSDVQRSYG